VIVEPGTPVGYLNILKVRNMFFGVDGEERFSDQKTKVEFNPNPPRTTPKIRDGHFHIVAPVIFSFSSSFFFKFLFIFFSI